MSLSACGPFDRCARQQIGHDLDPLFDTAQCVLEIHDHEPEQPQDEQ